MVLEQGGRNLGDLEGVVSAQTEMTRFAQLWLRQRPGSDVALFTAMAHVIVEEQLYNRDFVASRTEGFAEYIGSLEEATPEWAAAITGVPAAIASSGVSPNPS